MDKNADNDPSIVEENGQKFSKIAEACVRHDVKMASTSELENVVCEEVTAKDIDADHIDLTKRMFRFLADVGGLGLAAPQMGVKKRFFILWDI